MGAERRSRSVSGVRQRSQQGGSSNSAKLVTGSLTEELLTICCKKISSDWNVGYFCPREVQRESRDQPGYHPAELRRELD
ncbi:hypothetical protein NDU88_003147 [Pleurodeles waltl]|uniref:Uncharacterized protein n=1 Tax=Pleurodeles waltl TaxID=8319 RepID=A0AAV7KU29_PLEWA|nr:hypothetical protein NDU88_003147 [Pleurodeles waltl]